MHYHLNPHQTTLLAFALGATVPALSKASQGGTHATLELELGKKLFASAQSGELSLNDIEAKLLVIAMQTAATTPGAPPGYAQEFDDLIGIIRSGVSGERARGSTG